MNICVRLTFPFLIASSILFYVGLVLFSTPQIPNILFILPAFVFMVIYTIKALKLRSKFTAGIQEVLYLGIVSLFLIYGIVMGNSVKNILYDIIILVGPIIIYLVAKNYFVALPKNSENLDLRISINKALLIAILVIPFFGGAIALFLLVILYFVIYTKKKIGLKYLLFIILVISLIAFRGSKTYLLILAFNFIIIQYIRGNARIGIFVLSIFSGFIMYLNIYHYDSVSSVSKTAFKLFALFNNIDFELMVSSLFSLNAELIWEAVDISTGQRIFEFISVLNELVTENNLLLGKGLGGTADLSATQDLSIVVRRESGDVSNVRVFHLMITWMLNKTGILGLLLFVTYLITLFRRHNKNLNKSSKFIYYSIWIAFIFRISITFGSFLVHYYFSILFAYFALLNMTKKTIFRENECQK